MPRMLNFSVSGTSEESIRVANVWERVLSRKRFLESDPHKHWSRTLWPAFMLSPLCGMPHRANLMCDHLRCWGRRALLDLGVWSTVPCNKTVTGRGCPGQCGTADDSKRQLYFCAWCHNQDKVGKQGHVRFWRRMHAHIHSHSKLPLLVVLNGSVQAVVFVSGLFLVHRS